MTAKATTKPSVAPAPTRPTGPTRHDMQKPPPRGVSPASRQMLREQAEAAALAEIDADLTARKRQSEKLRALRLAQQQKS